MPGPWALCSAVIGRDGARGPGIFRASWTSLGHLVAQQSEGLTILSSCHLEQKKTEERAEEQIEGSCLRGREGLFQVEQRQMKSRDGRF